MSKFPKLSENLKKQKFALTSISETVRDRVKQITHIVSDHLSKFSTKKQKFKKKNYFKSKFSGNLHFSETVLERVKLM